MTANTPDPTAEEAELVRLLSRPLAELPARYFYDDRGSQLFDEITRQPEYYPTDVELSILQANADDIVGHTAPRELAELGSGVGRKIQLLIEAGRRAGGLERLTFFDINRSFLEASVAEAETRYPGLHAHGIVGDFVQDVERLGRGEDRLLLFLGGTLGNFLPSSVPGFLGRIGGLMGPGEHLLVGVDLVKDPAILNAAYNDAAGVTAAFNVNILSSLGGRFGLRSRAADWAHRAFFDEENAWIEMRLVARRATSLELPRSGFQRSFAAGDEVRTELSCKYTRACLTGRLPNTGLTMAHWYTDPEQLFAMALLARS